MSTSISTDSLLGLLPEEIVDKYSLPAPFAGTQIFQWIWKGATSFDQMTNVSKSLRQELADTSRLRSGLVTARLEDAEGNKKLQIRFVSAVVEAVLLAQSRIDRDADETDEMQDAARFTACISSQCGCAMGCCFCKTGTLGLRRNLSAAEMLEQFLLLEHTASSPLGNVVFMGMGEPLANIAALRRACAILSHPKGRCLSPRRITVSTAGLIPGIIDLADHGPHLRLAVSLTTADQDQREALMPVAKSNPLPELRRAIAYYAEKSGRRPTLEAALLGDVNTSPAHAHAFAALAHDLGAHVNLIPWNPVPGLDFHEPTMQESRSFLHILEAAGVSATLRLRRGSAIAGACGQLG
jgi:23S rRNA (adenine2503-C2)-methyltransferase